MGKRQYVSLVTSAIKSLDSTDASTRYKKISKPSWRSSKLNIARGSWPARYRQLQDQWPRQWNTCWTLFLYPCNTFQKRCLLFAPLRSGIKPDMLSALRTAPLHMATLFLTMWIRDTQDLLVIRRVSTTFMKGRRSLLMEAADPACWPGRLWWSWKERRGQVK